MHLETWKYSQKFFPNIYLEAIIFLLSTQTTTVKHFIKKYRFAVMLCSMHIRMVVFFLPQPAQGLTLGWLSFTLFISLGLQLSSSTLYKLPSTSLFNRHFPISVHNITVNNKKFAADSASALVHYLMLDIVFLLYSCTSYPISAVLPSF